MKHADTSQVLLIEDNPSDVELFRRALSSLDLQLTVTPSGEEGIRLAKRDFPDLIVLDLVLEDITGESVCQTLKWSESEMLSNIPIVMVTSKDTAVDRVAGKALGATAYITKPYTRVELLEVVQKTLHESVEMHEEKDRVGVILENQNIKRWFDFLLQIKDLNQFDFRVYSSVREAEIEKTFEESDLILMMKDFEADGSFSELLKKMEECSSETPIIYLSHGESNWLSKSETSFFFDVIQMDESNYQRLYKTMQLALKYKRKMNYFLKMSVSDDLTGLLNRRGLFKELSKTMTTCYRKRRPMALFLIDINDFKRVNDDYGHTVGDCILEEAASLFRRIFRSSDTIARYGGDEFILGIPLHAEENVHPILHRIERELTRYNRFASPSKQFHWSIGYSIYKPGEMKCINQLITEADTNMYEKKKGEDKG